MCDINNVVYIKLSYSVYEILKKIFELTWLLILFWKKLLTILNYMIKNIFQVF